MKTRKSFRLLALLLALCALMSLSVFAVGGEGGIEPHGYCNGNHVWTIYSTGIVYTNLGGVGHEAKTLFVRECTICGVTDPVDPQIKREAHSLKSTLQNEYHQGNQHIAVYHRTCRRCSYDVTDQVSGSCSGNPHIIP